MSTTGAAPLSASARRFTSRATLFLQLWLVVAFIVFVLRRDRENVFLTLAVIGLTVVPAYVLRRSRVYVPPEFQLIAVLFVFLSLFLGSAGDFYDRFWWWDVLLHTGSGFLFGIVGWIVMFLLLETDRLPRAIGPALLSAFGICFAVTLGVVWEIFEYGVDLLWPRINMMSHETGVADTMHDLIVDLIGALLVGVIGYAYTRRGRFSFVIDAVRRFMHRNPRLFRRAARRARGVRSGVGG
jgi:hypothetical protein